MIEQFQELATHLRQRVPRLVELAHSLEAGLRNGDSRIVNAQEAVFVQDRVGRILHHNRSFFPELADLVGKRCVDFLPDGLKGLFQLTDEFVNRARQPVVVTHPDPRNMESGALFETIKAPLFHPDGKIQGCLGIMSLLQGPVQPVVEVSEPSQDTLYMEMRPELWSEVHQAHAKLRQLSARQKSVVAMISEGLKQEAISRKLDISRKTVEKHREAASKKLSARSYAELIRLATLGQIISPLEYLGGEGVAEAEDEPQDSQEEASGLQDDFQD